jgi:site-specific recombinase XerD
MSAIDEEDFESWLRGQGYAERTVQDTVMAANGIVASVRAGETVNPGQWTRARRLLRYAKARSMPIAREPGLIDAASMDNLRQARRDNKKRKLEARSVDDAAWGRLAKAVMANPSREARVLELLMLTGLRIGDALRTRRTAIVESFHTGRLDIVQKGGRSRALAIDGPLRHSLERLIATWSREAEGVRRNARDITGWLIPESEARLPIDSARKSVYRLLRELGKEADVRGRLHLHRMRRTVAVQALRETGDLEAVRQLLGSASLASVRPYIDEARIQDVAQLRSKLHDRFFKN